MRTFVFLWAILSGFATPAVAQLSFVGPFAEPADGGNLDVVNSSFDGTTVTIVPRAHASESVSGATRWRTVSFAIRGMQGKTPLFRLFLRSPLTGHDIQSNDATTLANLKLVWSYSSGGPWNSFSTLTRTGTGSSTRRLDAKNNSAFTQDIVYVAINEPAPVGPFYNWIEDVVLPHPWVQATASQASAGTFMIGVQAGAPAGGPSAPVSRAIGDQPLYAFAIRDPARTPTKLVVLANGQRGAEGQSKAALRGALDWILHSTSAEAQAYRAHYVTLVYPHINPSGDRAGLWRGPAFDPTKDLNQHWNTTLTTPSENRAIDTVIVHKRAMNTDVAALGLAEPYAFLVYHENFGDDPHHPRYLARSSPSTWSAAPPARHFAATLGQDYYNRLNALVPLSDRLSDPSDGKTLRGYAIERGSLLPVALLGSVYGTIAEETAFGAASVQALVSSSMVGGPPPASLTTWVFHGSSTTAGSGLNPVTDRYGDQVAAMRGWGALGSGNSNQYHVRGVGGATFTTLDPDAASHLDPLIVAGRRNILVVQAGTNDVKTQTVSQVLAAAKAYCAARRTAGWEVYVILGTWPKHGSTTTNANNHNARMPQLNEAILADPTFFDGTYASGVFRLDAETVLKDTTLTAYWLSDGIHMNAAGHRLFAEVLNSEISALLAGDTSHPNVSFASAPAPGATVSGTVTIAGSATDPQGIAWVELWQGVPTLEGKAMTMTRIGNRLMSPPFTWQWNTNSAPTGEVRLFFRAQDSSGNYGITPARAVVVASSATAPTITTQPTSRSVAEGQSTAFSVTAGGTSPLTYQWQKDGANLSGATSASYTIASVLPGHAGSYRVIVSNSAGSATSHAATLTVSPSAPSGPVAVDDTFSGSGLLNDRTPDTIAPASATWRIESGNCPIADGFASSNTTLRATIESGVASGAVEATLDHGGSTTGLIVRSTNSSNYLRIGFSDTSLKLYVTEGGTTTTLKTVAGNFPRGQMHRLKVVLAGSSIVISIDEVTLISATTTFNQHATRHGLFASGSGVRKWDRFTVTK